MMNNQKFVRDYSQSKLDDNTRSTVDHDGMPFMSQYIVIENLKNNVLTRKELGSSNR